MQDDKNPAQPTPPLSTSPGPVKPAAPEQKSKPLRYAAIGLFCFILSFLGASAAIESGLVRTSSSSLSEKRNAVSLEAEVVADVAKRVSPSVVSIVTETEATVGLRPFTQASSGSGMIISADGYILTNKHVVEGAQLIEVVLADGTSFDDVKFVGADPANDIAFLKINGAKDLTPVTIGDSSTAEVGEKVIAIGNALGQYQTSVTSGIVSGLGRPLVAGDQATGETERLNNLLQTDAAINPGNSGGPLVNIDGEIIGINTAVDQEAQGIGFAIPINDAKGLIASVKKTGTVKRAFLGVVHVMVTADVVKEYELNVKTGAYIVNEDGDAVAADSPAARAGIKEGDVITKVNGKNLSMTYPLLSAISGFQPGDTVRITYNRDGKENTVEATLAPYPNS